MHQWSLTSETPNISEYSRGHERIVVLYDGHDVAATHAAGQYRYRDAFDHTLRVLQDRNLLAPPAGD